MHLCRLWSNWPLKLQEAGTEDCKNATIPCAQLRMRGVRICATELQIYSNFVTGGVFLSF